ncbi:hypothetical protein Acsp03_36850 [Actinomadura sp. NBRC 104412]|uniref:hypothetical protein n=1 Tax=Actinomadura sp. NBRC 104412 TaxID=3032203 RepID=UPI0024A33543|nr:hypothetical protein [Actinomadura sp. NBRC 104412]GLZ06219.1 hypothetical protein Acsp03_36850 [Actinomadura sp. NBRC 104412]
MNWRAACAVAGVVALVLTGCGQNAKDPRQDDYQHLKRAISGLEQPHRADVEVKVFVNGMGFPPIKMNAEMRGVQRSDPGHPATDLDLRSVTTTIEREYNEDLVRNGAVRVIVVGDRTYVRNTLQSSKWRTLPAPAAVVGDRGLDPAATGAMLRTTMVAAMFRSKGTLAGPPSPTTTAGMKTRRYWISCTVDDCLEDVPDLRDIARKVYPRDAVIQLRLFVDDQDRPRLLEVESEFPVGNKDMTRGVLVTFKAKLTLHEHGKPQQISVPAH